MIADICKKMPSFNVTAVVITEIAVSNHKGITRLGSFSAAG
jgi:hypothetical protein